MRPSLTRIVATCLLPGMLVGACEQRDPPLAALVPDLDPRLATRLVHDDNAALRRHARTIGRTSLARAASQMIAAPPFDSIPEFLRAERAIAPFHRRVADVLATEFQDELVRRTYAQYSRYGVLDRMAIVRLLRESRSLVADTGLPVAVRADRLASVIERAARFPDVLNVADLHGVYASLLPTLRRRDEVPHVLRRGIDAAVDFGDSSMACQLLGTLGYSHQLNGDDDAMRACWDRALLYARRARSWHESRILSFYAAFYRSRGQLAIARDLVVESQDRCRELGASEAELRFVIDAIHYFAQLRSWDLVEQGLQRADLVRAESREKLSAVDMQLEDARLDVLRACHRASLGRRHEARVLALAVTARTQAWNLGPQRAVPIQLQAARALSMSGFFRDARVLLEKSMRQCHAVPIPEQLDLVALALAEAYLADGMPDSCAAILAGLPTPTPAASVQRAVIELRLAIARGERDAALSRLQAALDQLDEWLAGATNSDEIAIALHDDLHRLGHDLLSESPEAGFAFEMQWRRPLRHRPRFGPRLPAPAFVASLERLARDHCARLGARDAAHCVYDVRDDRIVRFVATAKGIERVALTLQPEAIRSHVDTLCEAISQPETIFDTGRQRRSADAAARTLGAALLPRELHVAGSPALALFTANGWLARLPFEALAVDPSGTPLLVTRDVARVRYWQRPPAGQDRGRDSAIVVSDPLLSESMRRRYSVLAEPLPRSAAEAAYACSLLPRAVALTSDRATKRDLLARWERARLLYFAGHAVQDPDLPWVSFIPLAQAASDHDDDSYLEPSDIRRADLDRCRLAVLSSCGSGAPYTTGGVSAPSLADAFLAAGVQAVVSTGWAVRDEAADRVMRAFMREIVTGNGDPIAALCRVRRRMALDGADAHTWAVYSISTRFLPESHPTVASARSSRAGSPSTR